MTEPVLTGNLPRSRDDFRPGIALVVCYSPFQDLPQDNLRDKKTISMSLVYVPEHWILPSFMEAAYVVNRARDAKDSPWYDVVGPDPQKVSLLPRYQFPGI